MKNPGTISVSVFLMATLCGCFHDPFVQPHTHTLPAVTQNGANTFGCTADGEIVIPSGGGLYSIKSWQYSNHYVSFAFSDHSSDPTRYVNIMFGPVTCDSSFIVHYSDTLPLQKFKYVTAAVPSGLYHEYLPISSYSGMMAVSRLDTISKIIAGTFYFDAVDTTTGEVVQIRDGRFDFKY